MTKITYTENLQQTTVAGFRAWITNLSQALTACGLVRATDGGQLDPAAIAYPTTTNQMCGYEIYRFNDTLQATKPIFLKVEYGSSNYAYAPQIRVTVGTGTTGAGVITGPQGTQTVFVSGTPSSPNDAQTWVSHSAGGSFVLVWAARAISNDPKALKFVVIDRARDDTGAPLGEAVLYMCSITDRSIQQNILQTGSAPITSPSTLPQCLVPFGVSGSAVGTDVQLFRHVIMAPKVRHSLAVLSYYDNEIGAGQEIVVSPFGTAHTYLTLGSLYGPPNFSNYAAQASAAAAVLWEA